MPQFPPPGSTVHRTTARVFPVNAGGRVLLLHGWEPNNPDRSYWFSVGGAVEAGENLRQAGARELAEETGIVVEPADLGQPLGERSLAFDWGEWHLIQSETYFAVRVEADPDLSGLDSIEKDTIDRAGWWTPDELAADGTAVNEYLVPVMRSALVALGSSSPRSTRPEPHRARG